MPKTAVDIVLEQLGFPAAKDEVSSSAEPSVAKREKPVHSSLAAELDLSKTRMELEDITARLKKLGEKPPKEIPDSPNTVIRQGTETAPPPVIPETDRGRQGKSNQGYKVSRNRGPNIQRAQERTGYEAALVMELTAVSQEIEKGNSLRELHRRFQDYEIWKILSPIEQGELLTQEFKAKCYARHLTARKFGVGLEALKKSRLIVKKQKRSS